MAAVSTSHQAGIPSSSISGTDKNEVVFLEPAIISLPANIQEQLSDLEHQFKEGDLTEKGYHKRRSLILIPYLIPYHDPKEVQRNDGNVIEPELELLPKPVVEELKKLQEELGNEEITEKGFQKRRALILAPYMLKEPPRNELPVNIQQEYANLEQEFKEGDITDKGFRKKKIKLLKPYLVAVNPTTYTDLKQKKDSTAEGTKGKQLEKVVMGIQSVMNDGQKLFKCGVCGEVFKQAHSFSGHCRIHRAERVKDYKCSICNAAYSTKSHLKFHMYKHTGNFPFTCQYCGKGFAGRSQHKSHESRHTGESPYPCRQCGARFWKKENYDLHIETSCLHKNWTSGTNMNSGHAQNRKTTWSQAGSQEPADNIVSRKMSENVENRKILWTPTPSDQESEIIEQRKIPWTPTATEQHGQVT